MAAYEAIEMTEHSVIIKPQLNNMPGGEKRNIWTAAQLGDLFRIQEILMEQPGMLNAPSPKDQVPALHWATLNNHFSIVRFLLDQGAEVNGLGGEQWTTAMHWAASKGHLDAMSCLVQFGADLGLRDGTGYTAMHIAAQHGQSLAVLYLVALGVEVDERDGFGRTPLLWACFRGHVETAQVLIQERANVDALDQAGTSILQWSVIKGSFHIARLLLKNRADPTIKDGKEHTAADWAKQKGHYEWFGSLLIEFGRKSLLKDLQVTQANYWRQSRQTSKFFLGRVFPLLFLPFVWFTLWWSSPWILGIGIVVAISMGYDNFLRPLLFPSVPPMEAGTVFMYQFIIFAMGFFLELFVFLPNTSSHRLPHIISWVTTLVSLYFLRRTHATDPGIIRPALASEDRHRLILELVSESEFTRRKYCVTCRIKKPLRSKHCRICDVCVAKFDHHCPWTNGCVGVGNHRPFIFYVYNTVLTIIANIWICSLYLSSLSIERTTVGRFCILGEVWCKRSAVAPMVFIYMCEKIFFILWVGFLLVTQTLQIASNKTTNEMSNAGRLEYFMMDTSVPDDEDTNFGEHVHGDSCKHPPSKSTMKLRNPFDKGVFFNCTEFCLGASDHVYYNIHEVPSDKIDQPPIPAPQPNLTIIVNSSSVKATGEQLV